MRTDKNLPRWVVWLWATAMEAVTGGTVVAGAVSIVAVGYLWIWGAIAGPPLVRWPLITMALLTALVLIGRWFDRREQRIPAPPFSESPYLRFPTMHTATVVPTSSDSHGGATTMLIRRARLQMQASDCGSIRPLWGTPGAILVCELSKGHRLDESDHQVSRPNGRYLWGRGKDGGSPRWMPDDHWTGDDRLPPKEPFDWKDHRQAGPVRAQIERTEPDAPQS